MEKLAESVHGYGFGREPPLEVLPPPPVNPGLICRPCWPDSFAAQAAIVPSLPLQNYLLFVPHDATSFRVFRSRQHLSSAGGATAERMAPQPHRS